MTTPKTKRSSLACERNKGPILQKLKEHFPAAGHILEIASGTGQHADFFTTQMPEWDWQATDPDLESLSSIEAYCVESGNKNFLAPKLLSTTDVIWNIDKYDAALCCNMIHISPWESCLGLFHQLSHHLNPQAILALYGPFFQENVKTAPSNASFDQSLKERNPAWGIRSLSEVKSTAKEHGFELIQVHDMPAHNLMLIFKFAKQSHAAEPNKPPRA